MIFKIFEGKDILICLLIVSGKIEVVCVFLIENLKLRFKVWIILYICLIRVLVNDIYERFYL